MRSPTEEELAQLRERLAAAGGPSLKVLLTKLHPDGATAEQLAKDGFLGDLHSALKRRRSGSSRRTVAIVWIGDATLREILKHPHTKKPNACWATM